MSLGPTYTITGSPIATDADPNSTAPSGARKFSPPALSVGPAELWMYREDGGSDTLNFELWFHDATNGNWVLIFQGASYAAKYLSLVPFEFGSTAELFLRITNNPGNATKVAYGFGIGSVAV